MWLLFYKRVESTIHVLLATTINTKTHFLILNIKWNNYKFYKNILIYILLNYFKSTYSFYHENNMWSIYWYLICIFLYNYNFKLNRHFIDLSRIKFG